MKKMLSGLVVAAFALVAVAPVSAIAAPRAKAPSSIEKAQASTEKKAPAKKQAAKKAPAKKQTAKKAPAKKPAAKTA